MADILNLRQARKRRARDAARREGDANAVKHGRPKAARRLDAAVTSLETRRLDGHRRDREAPDPQTDPDTGADDAPGSAGPDERD